MADTAVILTLVVIIFVTPELLLLAITARPQLPRPELLIAVDRT
jgi:hypothetical protein